MDDNDNDMWPERACIICKVPIGISEPGTCLHENGLIHHLFCTLTPEMEEELVSLTKTM